MQDNILKSILANNFTIYKEENTLITQTRNEVTNQFNILKTEGFSSYAKYVEARTKEKEECLSKRKYYKLKKKEKEELSKLPLPMTCEVTYAYDPNDVPLDVKNLIAYARALDPKFDDCYFVHFADHLSAASNLCLKATWGWVSFRLPNAFLRRSL